MIAKLVLRHLKRRPGRTGLTVGGVASAIFLFVCIESLGRGLDAALSTSGSARTLIVYRENRYCPQTSFLPERYAAKIRDVAGVVAVLPVKVYLSNCRASLDAVAFHGCPVDDALAFRGIELATGDLGRFRDERGAALVGEEFAARRGLTAGDRFEFGDITVDVAGTFRSADPVDEGLILTHLEFLQRAGPVDRLGTVTQFEVEIDDARSADRIARQIDALFASTEEPTATRPRAEFLSGATRELREILRFARVFGFVCVLVVIVLVANTVLLSMQERRREFGVYLAIGYHAERLVALVLWEAACLTALGAALGLIAAMLVIHRSHISIAVEGIGVTFALPARTLWMAVAVTAGAALTAAAAPAVAAARSDVRRLLWSA